MNKNAIVTGASRGIGRSIAIKLAKEGYHVLINCAHSSDELSIVQREIQSFGGICEFFAGDISSCETAANLIEHAHHTLGCIDVLVNNAGIAHIGLVQDMTFHQWNQIMNTNLNSAFYLSKLVIPDMLAKQAGSILNISSVWGLCGASCEVAYSTAKGGLNAFTKALAKELAPSHIAVNAIACGAVDTSMNHCFSRDELDALCEEIPAGRMATPDEVAEVALHILQSPSYLTGDIIKLDGGWI